MDTLLDVKNLKKFFKTPGGMLHAVDGLTFNIDRGKTLGIVGESGCGKSTLGRTVIGLLSKSGGDVFFEGRNIKTLTKDESLELRKKMQMIFQDPFSSLNPRMTVSESIAEGLIAHNICKNGIELNRQVSNLMDTVGLASRFALSYPHELDGGRRQRIGIARALALNPKFIVCDEPVSALDVSIQAQILNLLQDLQEEKGLTYMFITHNLSVVKHISTEIMVMYLGRLVEKSPSDELFEHTLHPYTQALLSAIPTVNLDGKKERIILQGEIFSPINPNPGCRFAARCVYSREKCREIDPEINEVTPGHFVACHFMEEINGIHVK
ncbi:MAG: ATP-binding cassette domain-containing protein [Synergistaceae bacterium]|jgi:peptide/nickel transport system ATP-binding protein|nr:ATP-binding cassette domain-containing protein [Synergistaceae bacterium]